MENCCTYTPSKEKLQKQIDRKNEQLETSAEEIARHVRQLSRIMGANFLCLLTIALALFARFGDLLAVHPLEAFGCLVGGFAVLAADAFLSWLTVMVRDGLTNEVKGMRREGR